MLCLLYEFDVLKKDEEKFKKIWHDLTKIIRETRGGLGSRLHKDSSKENTWIAYAQWPSESVWKESTATTNAKYSELVKQMKGVCNAIRMVYKLDMVDDLLIAAK